MGHEDNAGPVEAQEEEERRERTKKKQASNSPERGKQNVRQVVEESPQGTRTTSTSLAVEDQEEEVDSPEPATRPAANPFDLLDEGDPEQNEDEDESELVNDSLVENKEEVESSRVKKDSESVAASKPKSKKKKKKKKSKAGVNLVEGEMDRGLEELSLDISSAKSKKSDKSNAENGKQQDEGNKQHALSILQVDPKFLNPENELRRIFGSKVVKSFKRSSQASGSRQIRGGRRGVLHTKKTVLVSPSEHWRRWDGSLSMELLESKGGYHYFRYVHSSTYDQARRAFEAAKAIHDLNGIASILLHYPYHLDSLITMADYFKFVGEHQMSADAIAKSLYALECAWHPMFTAMQGNCQLKFNHESNKPLCATLFTHMKNLDRRGCHRSALEVCKLLLSLDVDDPMGAMFCIDYFSLRAEEYAWLECFSESYQSDNSLWLFPNFSYSLAVCRLFLEREELSSDSRISAKATSGDLMKQALLLHPSVLKSLVAKVPLKDRAWTDILQNSFFRSEKIGSPSLDHLINIYVEKSYIMWRLPDLQKLLQDAALEVTKMLEHDSTAAKDWACARTEAFSCENNEYGHLLVSDFSDVVATLPPENLQDFMVDPQMREVEQNGIEIDDIDHGGPAPRDVANRNPLAVLFESMLPWVVYEPREDGEGQEENHVNEHEQDDAN